MNSKDKLLLEFFDFVTTAIYFYCLLERVRSQETSNSELQIGIIGKEKYFTERRNSIDNSFSVTLKVSCYNELNLMVSDLLKASIILLNEDARNLSSLTTVTDTNVMTLLEIALQLLPEEEMELLDDLHKIHLKADTYTNR